MAAEYVEIDGFVSQLSYYPDADLYIAVLANTGSPVPGSLSEQLARNRARYPIGRAEGSFYPLGSNPGPNSSIKR